MGYCCWPALQSLHTSGEAAAAAKKPVPRPLAAMAAAAAAAAAALHGSSEPSAKPGKLVKQGSTNAAFARAATAAADNDDFGDDDPEGALVVSEKQRPKQQQQQLVLIKQEPDLIKVEAAARAPRIAAGTARTVTEPGSNTSRRLEVFVEPPGGGKWLATHVDLAKVRSFVDLWRQLQTALPQLQLGSWASQQLGRVKLVYMDADGDWVLAMPDQRWQSFVDVAQRVLLTTSC